MYVYVYIIGMKKYDTPLRTPVIAVECFRVLLYLLDKLNHIHIWQVSPQLSCGDTCQIWIRYLKVSPQFHKRFINLQMVELSPS